MSLLDTFHGQHAYKAYCKLNDFLIDQHPTKGQRLYYGFFVVPITFAAKIATFIAGPIENVATGAIHLFASAFADNKNKELKIARDFILFEFPLSAASNLFKVIVSPVTLLVDEKYALFDPSKFEKRRMNMSDDSTIWVQSFKSEDFIKYDKKLTAEEKSLVEMVKVKNTKGIPLSILESLSCAKLILKIAILATKDEKKEFENQFKRESAKSKAGDNEEIKLENTSARTCASYLIECAKKYDIEVKDDMVKQVASGKMKNSEVYELMSPLRKQIYFKLHPDKYESLKVPREKRAEREEDFKMSQAAFKRIEQLGKGS